MIGIFDSGLGGLSVLREIEKVLPGYRYMYVGDTARAPYGPRTSAEVHQFTLEAVEFLFAQGCELVVLACNTASAEALRRIQREYLPSHYPGRRILGVIVPAAEEALGRTRNDRIGVIATEGTVRSGAFVNELRKLRPGIRVSQQACPLLVPLVEAGEHDSPASKKAVQEYLRPLLDDGVDTLILGCTHYEHLVAHIRQAAGARVVIVSEAEVIARKLAEYLGRHPELEGRLFRSPAVTFFTTDAPHRFRELGSRFFGRDIRPVLIRLTASPAAL